MRYVAPQQPDRAPLVKLRERLEWARRQGEDFGTAWAPAVAVALEGLTSDERRGWWRALQRTREAWERCYERRPADEVDSALELIWADRETPLDGQRLAA
jgi:hypothetical protein